jgi:hypothetical protein
MTGTSIDNDIFGNAQLTVDAGQILTLDGTTITGGSITDSGTITNAGTIEITVSAPRQRLTNRRSHWLYRFESGRSALHRRCRSVRRRPDR